MIFWYGDSLFDTQTPLQPLSLDALCERMRTDAQLQDNITRLRRLRALDQDTYRRMKTRLPFFCCATFAENQRRTDRFERTEAFVLDLDGCATTPEAMTHWRTMLPKDPRLLLLFTSPGGDGLKLVFRLATPCTDTKQFSDFYKAFAIEFAKTHDLSAYIDLRTSDCTRACFLSYDPELYVQHFCESVDWSAYVLPVEPTTPPAAEQPNQSHHIRPDVYADILRKLQTRPRPKNPLGPGRIPTALEAFLPLMREQCASHNLAVLEELPIPYGLKLKIGQALDHAEINVFHGKKGFSVVQVPKRGTNASLAELIVFLAEEALRGRHFPTGEAASDEAPPQTDMP
ncbi:MAG TPA: CRISPR-associated primase-polymerase type B [Saprospiraceae bacterium]|nr:CRISPR-associated primase-polymerase type B [Saprospiraceae bacterium]HMP25990.1 CRISPR-associated primase-polymerase type B [Saprospiraceae bacterium]